MRQEDCKPKGCWGYITNTIPVFKQPDNHKGREEKYKLIQNQWKITCGVLYLESWSCDVGLNLGFCLFPDRLAWFPQMLYKLFIGYIYLPDRSMHLADFPSADACHVMCAYHPQSSMENTKQGLCCLCLGLYVYSPNI